MIATVPPPFWIAVAAVVGLVVGSYLNVVIHRLPEGESTVTPASRCPACGARIRWYDNLPLVSWLALGGRCRDCRAPISLRYPIVEAATAIAFGGAVVRFGPRPDAVMAALLAALLIALAAIDLDHFLLPDRLTLPGIALGLAGQLAVEHGSLARGLAGALVGAGLLLVVAGAWELVRGSEGMGLGDVKMIAMIGAFLGTAGVAVTLVLGTFAGSIVGLAAVARGSGSLSAKLPFGVFLALGGMIALFAGRELVGWYLGFGLAGLAP
jgi:leader peptidase (prepilin peptidase)/N-methyltransferase